MKSNIRVIFKASMELNYEALNKTNEKNLMLIYYFINKNHLVKK